MFVQILASDRTDVVTNRISINLLIMFCSQQTI